MQVLVLGAGVVGVTTAYFLATRGHKVTVIDRQPSAAQETSLANGGQLSYTHAQPWANPAVLPKALKWMFHEDAPLIFRFQPDPYMISWGIRFLRNCTTARAHHNAEQILKLGLYSKKMLALVASGTQVEFDHLEKGVLHIFNDPKEFEGAKAVAEFERGLGSADRIISGEEALALEPSLQHAKRKIIGGIHHTLDESGDVHLFTTGLAEYCAKLGVEFLYGTEVRSIARQGKRIAAVKTSKGDFTADAYVMSFASHSAPVLRSIGISVPVYPMKGYSITLPIAGSNAAPMISITDDAKKIVYSRLGNRLRAAGTAEFAGYNSEITPVRSDAILNAAKELFPQAGDFSKVERWMGLRPATPDGVPIIGRTEYDNLFLNTGHGTLGWTLSCGSARVLADIMEEKTPEIPVEGLSAARFHALPFM
ncbi:MAG: D-amino acid dehydrogenase [Alphaproteobacteria bacterium]|nr:D-amino acid dehydrogenase [Alphaproteobacteria bacterium]